MTDAGCQVVEGDIFDLASVRRALEGAEAVYVSIHTLSPQPARGRSARFMDIEVRGLENVVTAGRSGGASRVIYVTSLGTAPAGPSEWLRERWRSEEMLLASGLDATVIQPGTIVGVGGRGFDTVVSQARRRLAVTLGGDRPWMRSIAIDDLTYYLRGVLDDPRTHGQRYAVGNDDVLSMNQMIDIVAGMVGGRVPGKVQIPRALLRGLGRLPAGAISGLVDSLGTDLVGDPAPIRAILPRRLLSFPAASERALAGEGLRVQG